MQIAKLLGWQHRCSQRAVWAEAVEWIRRTALICGSRSQTRSAKTWPGHNCVASLRRHVSGRTGDLMQRVRTVGRQDERCYTPVVLRDEGRKGSPFLVLAIAGGDSTGNLTCHVIGDARTLATT